VSAVAQGEPWRLAFASMGCPCEIRIEGVSDEQASRVASLARTEVDRLDRKYSHYRDDSLAARLERETVAQAVEVDDETANLLDFAAALHEQSDGLFDITAGPLTRLWDAQRQALPEAAAISLALERVGWNQVDWQRPLLRLRRDDMHLDLGGMVKEYAADRAAAICRESGIAHGIIDLGGDLAVIGAHIDGSAWRVGIKDPSDPSRAIAQIDSAYGGLATSGDYERALVVDGRRYSHIVDPRSGWPMTSFASVSVLGPSCLVAGAASTLAMLLGCADGARYLEELGLAYLCVGQDGRMSGRLA
jgi:thiamine biosynthesis lipoprotein